MTRQQFSENFYLLGLMLLVAAMPLSVFMMSIAQFTLLFSWIIGGNIVDKIKLAFSNPVVAVLVVVYFLHLVGGFYSTDFDYFFNDAKIKLPLLILPVLIYTSPKISKEWFERIMGIFVLAVLTSSIISMGVLHDILPHKNPVSDIRDISVFVSHIRLGLFVCFSIFCCGYYLVSYHHQSFIKNILTLAFILWFIIFLFILEAITGVVILIVTTVILSWYFSFRQKNMRLKAGVIFMTVAIPVFVFIYIKKEAGRLYRPQHIEISQLDINTINGNKYKHSLFEPLSELPYLNPKMQENGNPLATYVCVEEMKNAWNYRSSLDYDGLDLKKHELKYTLVRFLSSKGLRKDSAGVYNLSESEIQAVENGVPNVEYQKMGSLKIRLHKIIMEYYSFKFGENPTGKSMMQRLEYWKAGWNIFKQNFFTGVGTGDVQLAFNKEYKRMHSPLSESARHRAHNQYLTFAITFGVLGLIYFLFSLFYPLMKRIKNSDYFYVTFFIMVTLSMVTEDTLETQAGVTFFAFFNAFILFARLNSPSEI